MRASTLGFLCACRSSMTPCRPVIYEGRAVRTSISTGWRRIRTNTPLERVLLEVRHRTRGVRNFPNGESALMLVAARLRHISGTKWGTRK
ncbi:MAG: transposase [Myxococcota bacterium]